jgi:light-regulated signal transduction histidine kinase (bacteriophytochrome)
VGVGRRLNAELEQRVRERTAQLQAAHDELEAFSYSVSHDLRSPLRHIDGYVEMLLREAGAGLGEQSRNQLQTIRESARQMGQLIDGLLGLSRMTRSEMHFMEVDLAGMVRDILRHLQRDIGDRHVEWIVADLPSVHGDPTLLRQVIINLLSNAVKYTRPVPEARIEIGTREEAENRVFFVRDNGVGFDMQYVDKLFGVFQRLHRASEFEGTGIGLANVRRIILRHGGRTWAGGRRFISHCPNPMEVPNEIPQEYPARGGRPPRCRADTDGAPATGFDRRDGNHGGPRRGGGAGLPVPSGAL